MEKIETSSNQLSLNFDGGKFKTKPYKHQLECLNKFGRKEAFALLAEMGTGKAQPNDCKVMTPTGWKEIGSLKIGDDVFTSTGHTAPVVGVYPQGVKKVYKLTFNDNSSTRCCDEHLWVHSDPSSRMKYLKNKIGSPWKIGELKSFKNWVKDAAGNNRISIPLVSSPLNYDTKEVPIDPYCFGVLLGDGSFRGDSGITLSTSDDEIVKSFEMCFPGEISKNGNYDHSLIKNNSWSKAIDNFGLRKKYSQEKFVPDVYKFNDVSVRIAVLQGLLDSDGTVGGSTACFGSTSQRLAEDVAEIVRSLGGRARLRPVKAKRYTVKGEIKTGLPGFNVRISLPDQFVPFRLSRKVEKFAAHRKYKPQSKYLKSVEPNGEAECTCIAVDHPTHTYLTEGHTVTHNTWVIINNLADLWASGDCDAALVLAPNGVHTNWTRLELSKHMPDWVRMRAASWSASPNKAEKEALAKLFETPFVGDLRVLTMNHEALQSKKGFEFAEKFLRTTSKAMLVADESDAYKNPSAQRTKNLMKLKPLSSWRRIMSGTPINNAPFDAFSQFLFLDEFILGTTSYYAFKAEYAEMLDQYNPLVQNIMAKSRMRGVPQVVARGAGNRPKYRNLDKLSALMAPHSFRVLKSECLDLPEKIYKTLVFNMTKEQAAVYKKAEDECRLVFENEETPFNKLVAITKLAQITSGYYIHPMSEEPVRIDGDNPKLELLAERVAKVVEAGEKVIVWARYRIEIEDIVARLAKDGIAAVQYHGGVKKGERVEAIEAFENGEAQVFVGNQQAGGTGITLVAASYVIYFSNNFSLRDRLQSEDRAHRIGQTKNVTYINIAAKNTVDELVVRALNSKKDVADTIIDKGIALFSKI